MELYASTGAVVNWSELYSWGHNRGSGVWDEATRTFTPDVSPGWTPNSLIGLIAEIDGGRTSSVVSNTADSITFTGADAGDSGAKPSWILFNGPKPQAGDTVHLNGAAVIVDEATPDGLTIDPLNVDGNPVADSLLAPIGYTRG